MRRSAGAWSGKTSEVPFDIKRYRSVFVMPIIIKKEARFIAVWKVRI